MRGERGGERGGGLGGGFLGVQRREHQLLLEGGV